MERDEPRDVGFVLGTIDSWEDESLPEARDREWPWLRRARRPIGYALVVALAAFGVVKLASLGGTGVASPTDNPGGSSAVAAPSSASTHDLAQPSIAVHIPIISRGGDFISGQGEVPRCPAKLSCTTTDALPGAVVDGLRAVFPTARARSAVTITVTDRTGAHRSLLYRLVRATAGRREIAVRVIPSVAGTEPDAGHNTDGSLVFAQRVIAGFAVRITVIQPATAEVRTGPVAALASDERLLVTG